MGAADRRQRERETRKLAILEAAAAVFGAHGYQQAPMEAIAEKARVNIATVYYYYASKELLYVAFLGTAIESALPDLEREARSSAPAPERVRAMTRIYDDFHRRHPDLLVIADYASGPPDGRDAFADHALDVARRALSTASASLAAGVEKGELRDLDAETTTLVLWASLHGVLDAAARIEGDRSALVGRWLEVSLTGLARN
jgi:AcrR family transcriptional regulator